MTNPHLETAVSEHHELQGARMDVDQHERLRDEAIRAAIRGDEDNEPMTMYAVAKALDLPHQYVRRIRDRG
jgi:hypothetical protein